jgi:nicotinamide-nucleotide amidase
MIEAEIISIGDELTSGQRLDTNSQWISQQLADVGVRTARHVTVSDNLQVNLETLRQAASSRQIVVITGGLGPTLDDLTREAMAVAFDRPLQLDPRSLERIEQLFARRGRGMPERNRVQAMLPLGALAIDNPHGSAPGVDLTVQLDGNSCRLFALPGVPAEMKEMWHQSVKPALVSMLGSKLGSLYFHTVKLFGLGESDVEARVPTLIARDRNPTVGITVSRATISLRIVAQAQSQAQFESLIQPTLAEIHQNLGDIIFGTGDDELEHALLRDLTTQDLSLAVVEIGGDCYVGPAMLQAVAGSQTPNGKYFHGSIAFTSLEQALGTMGQSIVPADSPERQWLRLASVVRQKFQADIGLALGCYPAQHSLRALAAGTTLPFWMGMDFAPNIQRQTHVECKQVGGHPEILCSRMAKSGMDRLRRLLQNVALKNL